jgi:hypothetical protein
MHFGSWSRTPQPVNVSNVLLRELDNEPWNQAKELGLDFLEEAEPLPRLNMRTQNSWTAGVVTSLETLYLGIQVKKSGPRDRMQQQNYAGAKFDAVGMDDQRCQVGMLHAT